MQFNSNLAFSIIVQQYYQMQIPFQPTVTDFSCSCKGGEHSLHGRRFSSPTCSQSKHCVLLGMIFPFAAPQENLPLRLFMRRLLAIIMFKSLLFVTAQILVSESYTPYCFSVPPILTFKPFWQLCLKLLTLVGKSSMEEPRVDRLKKKNMVTEVQRAFICFKLFIFGVIFTERYESTSGSR